MAVNFDELSMALETTDSTHATVYVCMQTGKIYIDWESSDLGVSEEDMEELPDDIEDDDKYAVLPDKAQLDLGKRLVLDFASEFLPDDLNDVRDMMSRRGGYRKFRGLVTVRGFLERWYKFQNDETDHALRRWCKVVCEECGSAC